MLDNIPKVTVTITTLQSQIEHLSDRLASCTEAVHAAEQQAHIG